MWALTFLIDRNERVQTRHFTRGCILSIWLLRSIRQANWTEQAEHRSLALEFTSVWCTSWKWDTRWYSSANVRLQIVHTLRTCLWAVSMCFCNWLISLNPFEHFGQWNKTFASTTLRLDTDDFSSTFNWFCECPLVLMWSSSLWRSAKAMLQTLHLWLWRLCLCWRKSDVDLVENLQSEQIKVGCFVSMCLSLYPSELKQCLQEGIGVGCSDLTWLSLCHSELKQSLQNEQRKVWIGLECLVLTWQSFCSFVLKCCVQNDHWKDQLVLRCLDITWQSFSSSVLKCSEQNEHWKVFSFTWSFVGEFSIMFAHWGPW